MHGTFFTQLRKLASENPNSETASILSEPPPLTKWLEIPFGAKFAGFPLRELGSTRLVLREKEDYEKLAKACQDWLDINRDVDQDKYEFYIDSRLASRIGLLTDILSPMKGQSINIDKNNDSSRKSIRRRLRQRNGLSGSKTCQTSIEPKAKCRKNSESNLNRDFSSALSGTRQRLKDVPVPKFSDEVEKDPSINIFDCENNGTTPKGTAPKFDLELSGKKPQNRTAEGNIKMKPFFGTE